MRMLTLNGKNIAKPAAKVLVRTEPETLKLGDTFVSSLEEGEHPVQGATEKGFYARDQWGVTTDEFVVRRSSPWYGIIVVKNEQFRLVG